MKNPTDHANSGSTITATSTVSAINRRVRVGRPIATDKYANPAMIAARTTLGSTRVITTNQDKIVVVTTTRDLRPRRDNNGETAAKTKATFCPETATKWAKPESRNATVIAFGCRESSPITKPVNSARSASSNDSADFATRSRTRWALRNKGEAGNLVSPTCST